jgi:outer membrane protein TolC
MAQPKAIALLALFSLNAIAAPKPVSRSSEDELPVLSGVFDEKRCIEIALQNNHARAVSELTIAIAEAQHRQACSAWWPTLSLRGGMSLKSDDSELWIRNLSITTPPSSLSLPVNLSGSVSSSIATNLGGQFAQALASNPQLAAALASNPALAQQLNTVVSQLGANAGKLNAQLAASIPAKIPIPSQTIQVRNEKIELTDRATYGGSADLKWVVFDGGYRSGLTGQSRQGVEAARQDARRTDLQIAYDVRRYYAGALLAERSVRLGRDVELRLAATLTLTEQLFKNGSEKVKKNDYLRNKAMVEYVRAQVALAEGNRDLARAALAMTMGCSWRSDIHPVVGPDTLPNAAPETESMISEAYSFNPDWAKLQAGLSAAESNIRQQKSGWWPKVAFSGKVERLQNQAESNVIRNEVTWGVELGAEIPIFDGFLTSARVQEARARLAKLKQERILLREGVALQVKVACIRMATALKRHKLTGNAASVAGDNRDLCERAYAQDMLETKTLLDAQTEEALAKAEVYKAAFEHAEASAQLSFVVGSEVANQLNLQ